MYLMNDCIVKTHLKTAMFKYKLQLKLYQKYLALVDEEINFKGDNLSHKTCHATAT